MFSSLLVVLALFTLFSYKAPQGMKAMGALANAACASFLVEAFHDSLFGTQMGIEFLKGVGMANGSLGGVAAAILVPLALGVSPVYAVLVGLTVSGFGILSIIRYKILRKESSSWFRLNSYNISCCSIN